MIDLLKLILSVLAWLFKSRALGASVRASRALLRSLAEVGRSKPVGYLPQLNPQAAAAAAV